MELLRTTIVDVNISNSCCFYDNTYVETKNALVKTGSRLHRLNIYC
jgi:hypothetical protein